MTTLEPHPRRRRRTQLARLGQRDGGDFPIQNLPFAVFRRAGSAEPFRGGVAIGDQVLDLAALAAARLLDGLAAQDAAAACAQPALNDFFALGPAAWRALRHAPLRAARTRRRRRKPRSRRCATAWCRRPMSSTRCRRASATTPTSTPRSTTRSTSAGCSRPDDPMHAELPLDTDRLSRARRRASASAARRFAGRWARRCRRAPRRRSTARARGSTTSSSSASTSAAAIAPGEPIPLDARRGARLRHLPAQRLVGARHPVLGDGAARARSSAKNFATTVSPWIVTMEALAPYRAAVACGRADQPQPLAYLDGAANRAAGAIDIRLEAWLESEQRARQRWQRTRRASSRTSFRHQYWSIAQMVAHHTVGGCNLQPGRPVRQRHDLGPAGRARPAR